MHPLLSQRCLDKGRSNVLVGYSRRWFEIKGFQKFYRQKPDFSHKNRIKITYKIFCKLVKSQSVI